MQRPLWTELRRLLVPLGVAMAPLVVAVTVDRMADPGGGDAGFSYWAFCVPCLALLLGCASTARAGRPQAGDPGGAAANSRARVWWAKLVASLVVFIVGYAAAGSAALADFRASPWQPDSTRIAVAHFALSLCLFALGFAISGTRRGVLGALAAGVPAAAALCGSWLLVSALLLPWAFGPRLGIVFPETALPMSAGVGFGLALAFLAASWYGFRSTEPEEYRLRLHRTARPCALATPVIVALACLCVLWWGTPRFRDATQVSVVVAGASPDGRWLPVFGCLCPRDDSPHNAALWVLRTDGTGMRCVARPPVSDNVTWLPDSRHLVVEWDASSGPDLLPERLRHWAWLVDVETGTCQRLGPLGLSIDPVVVSPRGTYAIVDEKVWVLNPPHVLSRVVLPYGARDAVWSPDETTIYTPYGGSPDRVDSVSIETGEIRQGVAVAPGGAGFGRMDPAGRCVAWQHRTQPEPRDPETPFYDSATLNSLHDGRSVTVPGQLLPSSQSFSPDGRYCWIRHGDAFAIVDIAEMRVVRTTPAGLLTSARSAGHVLWTQDGRAVGSSQREPWRALIGPPPPLRMWVANADGSGPHPIPVPDDPRFARRWGVVVAGNALIVLAGHTQALRVDINSGAITTILDEHTAGEEDDP